jgi:hypothetical protein
MMITGTLRAESEHALDTGANLEIRWRLYLLWHFSDCLAFFTKFITEQILRADGDPCGTSNPAIEVL